MDEIESEVTASEPASETGEVTASESVEVFEPATVSSTETE